MEAGLVGDGFHHEVGPVADVGVGSHADGPAAYGLQKKGLVRRDPHPEDRRAHLVKLTAAGEALFHRAAKHLDKMEQEFLSPLTQAEQAAPSAADDVAHPGLPLFVLHVHDRFMLFGIERLPMGLDALESRFLQCAEQLAVDQFDPFTEAFGVAAGTVQSQLEGVENREQLFDQAGSCSFEVRRLVPQHPLAVVVEFRLRALQMGEVLVPLRGEAFELTAGAFDHDFGIEQLALRHIFGGVG